MAQERHSARAMRELIKESGLCGVEDKDVMSYAFQCVCSSAPKTISISNYDLPIFKALDDRNELFCSRCLDKLLG